MERLTERTKSGKLYLTPEPETDIYGNLTEKGFAQLDEIYDRLAAYEDIGIEPDEIPHWIDAESETPEIGQRVLLYLPDKEDDIRAGKYLGEGDYRIGMKVYRGYEIGAWMPLPQPPKEVRATI